MANDYQQALEKAAGCCPEARPELEALARWLPHALAECSDGPESLGADRQEKRGPARITVIITRCGTRLLDVDNGAGGCKALLDAIRYEGLIPNDDPDTIRFIFRQRKVARKDIGTEVVIVAPDTLTP